MQPLRRIIRGSLGAACAAIFAANASASFLDEDFWCQAYGCVVVHNGSELDIYDNWNFLTNECCVPVGSPMISYNRSVAPISFNFTGTLNSAAPPPSDHGSLFAITDGDTPINVFFDNGDGYLDAGDTMNAFGLDALTDIQLDNNAQSYSHSIYITSRNTRFSLRAQAFKSGATGDLAQNINLADVGFVPSLTRNGTDDGLSFGRQANRGNIKINNGVQTLGDIENIPTEIASFNRRQGIRKRNADLADQSIRLDFLYSLPQYDLSMGTGDLDLEVVFDFFRE